MIDYGRDISCSLSLDPTMREVTGDELMKQVILRRLITTRGGLLSAPFAVTVDLREYMSADFESADRLKHLVEAASSAAILDDPRVLSVKVRAELTGPRSMLVSVSGTGARGPFALTLAVNQLTIELLRPSENAAS